MTLDRVREKADAYREDKARLLESRASLVAAVIEARASHSLAEIQLAGGFKSRQHVFTLLKARSSHEEADLEARLAELNTRWERIIKKMGAFHKDIDGDRKEQAARNRLAKRRRKFGQGPLETVAQERRRIAETRLFELIAQNPKHELVRPFHGRVYVYSQAELDERDRILARLGELRDARAGF